MSWYGDMHLLPRIGRAKLAAPAAEGITSPNWDHTQLAITQYASLRAEIVQLCSLQAQMITLTVVAFGAILPVGLQARNAAIILIYPLLSLVLGLVWLYKAHAITRIATYLRTGVEARVGQQNLGWEHFVQEHPLPRRWLAYWAIRSVFPVTSALAIAVSFAVAAPGTALFILYCLAFMITLLTITMFILWREASPEFPRHGFSRSPHPKSDTSRPSGEPRIG